MMFAISVLIALAVLEDDLVAFAVKSGKLRPCRQEHHRAATFDRHLIQFLKQISLRKSCAGINVVARCSEKNIFSIGCKIIRQVSGGMIRQSFCLTTTSRHYVYIKISITVTGEGKPFTVATKNGHVVIRFVDSKWLPHRCWPLY